VSLGPAAARKRTRDLAEFIQAGAPKGTDVLEVAARELAPILDTEQTIALRLDASELGVSLTSMSSPFPSAAALERSFRDQLARLPRHSALFDPISPDPRQRNVVFTQEELRLLTGRTIREAPVGRLMLQNGFSLSDLVRTLLCDGPSLLAWFGAFRDRPFDERERSLLRRLVRPLRDRLTLQGRLAAMPWVSSAMRVVLGSTGAATLVFRRPMRLLYCNAPAQALLAADRAALLAGLRDELAGRGNGTWLVQPLPDVEGPEHFLAMRRLPPCDSAPRAAAAASRMALTPRQTRVLELVARGHGNKPIAAMLRCSESAVEQHVSALLRRYDVAGRAELVARFWTDAAY
jgi:DNA-binding CsgD family transcriptional regulator